MVILGKSVHYFYGNLIREGRIIDTSTLLAIIGLALALIELWVPKLSCILENWMTALVQPLLTAAVALKNTPAKLEEALDSFTKKTLPGLLFVGLPALAILLLLEEFKPDWLSGNVAAVLTTAILVASIPLLLSIGFRLFGGYIVYPIYAFAVLIASPAWFIKLANKMGNGKGISGFGLMLAFQGVLEPIFS